MNTKNVILPISSLFIAIAFLAIGYGMLMTFIGVYLKENGSSDMVIGTINASFFCRSYSFINIKSKDYINSGGAYT